VPSRRAVLLGASAAVAVAAAGTAAGVEQGVLPGRPWAQAHLGLNGEAGVVPDVEPGPVQRGSFTSTHRLGAEVGWALLRPPGDPNAVLPLVIALHGLGQDVDALLGPSMGIDRYLAAHVEAGGVPFAIAMADAGSTYYHPRPDGEDAGAMVMDELLPRLVQDVDRFVLPVPVSFLGWSMGGYGALRLAAEAGAGTVAAAVASSPAIWSDPDDASRSGFDDAEEYEEYSVVGHQRDLDGIAVRVDCGTGDPFYRDVQDYVEGFPDDRDGALVSTFEPGAHDAAYWRRMLPDQLAFLGSALAAVGSAA
jgi:enterochelin esterase-like enzyme